MNKRWIGLLIILCYGTFLASEASGQRTLGVAWDIPEQPAAAEAELNRFRAAGITHLELDQLPSARIWELSGQMGLSVYLRIPLNYLIVQDLAYPDSSLVSRYRNFLGEAAEKPNLAAIGMFAYSQTSSSTFPGVIAPYVRQIRQQFDLPIYYLTNDPTNRPVDRLFDFKLLETSTLDSLIMAGGSPHFDLLYNPKTHTRPRLASFKEFIESVPNNFSGVVFLRSNWLLSALDSFPRLSSVLTNYTRYPDAKFPLPEEQPASHTENDVIVIILLVIWGVVIAVFNYEPSYRKSLTRYFTSHTFFVEDVMNRQIRANMPSLLILVVHALSGGVFLYCVSATLFSATGINALFYHLGWLPHLGSGYIASFWFGAFLTLAFEILCLLWIYLPNQNLNFVSQLLPLYSWQLQLNLLIVTVMVTLLKSGSLDSFLWPLVILFILVLVSAFSLAAYDTSANLRNHRFLYRVGTVGLYTVGLVGLFAWLLNNDLLLNVIRLASSLS